MITSFLAELLGKESPKTFIHDFNEYFLWESKGPTTSGPKNYRGLLFDKTLFLGGVGMDWAFHPI